jgi:tripartite motif-containing protein 71
MRSTTGCVVRRIQRIGGLASRARAVTSLALGLATLVVLLAAPGPALGASGSWQRAWGMDVDSSQPGTGFENCTIAASCQAGSWGTLGGEFTNPEGVATDGFGDVYVADYAKHRVQKFDSAGNFERAWGRNVDSSQPGTGFEICTVAANCQAGETGTLGGELSSPRGIASDLLGRVYVVDYASNRIQAFDFNGNFERAWGRDVDSSPGAGFEICTVAANCQAGETGTLGGELHWPIGVAADPAGFVYVTDNFNSRIQKFDWDGNFQRAWGRDVDSVQPGTGPEVCTVAANCKAGTYGTLGGEFDYPFGVASDGAESAWEAGSVYVTDYNNSRIQEFDSDGNFQRAWGRDVDSVQPGTDFEICTVAASCKPGEWGGLGGELYNPVGVATDWGSASRVYVTDYNNSRVQRFGHDGDFQRAWGRNVDSTQPGSGFEICTAAAACQAGTTGGLGGELRAPEGIAAWGDDLYVADYYNRRVEKFGNPVPPPNPVVPPLPASPAPGPSASGGPTGQRAAALKKCRKINKEARKRCRAKGKKLPV